MKMQFLLSGSPTVELFAASYNSTEKSNTITLDLGVFGYKRDNTISNWLTPQDNHGIYNKSNSPYWWLASPSSINSNQLNVDGNVGYFNLSFVARNSYAVRPLVCIPTSVFNSKYATDTTLVND